MSELRVCPFVSPPIQNNDWTLTHLITSFKGNTDMYGNVANSSWKDKNITAELGTQQLHVHVAE